jgi:hypothetical protein
MMQVGGGDGQRPELMSSAFVTEHSFWRKIAVRILDVFVRQTFVS